ncbi:FAD:protein FMN transferase [Lysobacter niastensis]|uniref:FAD:protein FMN transferase n=1 Tax=Lysobacter niastensis TaxID=380629 RepID=A0ABS0B2H2_9GAMM|nr:FAD:protein FMN transferase [Lysobacter niastensis]MBF6022689.1 FAD:protein FMN transferase [Lysobacter niastensis]
MGTTWSAKLLTRADALPALERGIQARLDEVVAQMSTWEADSDLSRFNHAAQGTSHLLPPELCTVLGAALDLARDTAGAYDPTVGPLVNLWGFGPDGARTEAPAAQALAVARGRIGWQRVQFDPLTRTAVQPGDCHVDLSSIAKGYGVDRVADYLIAQGIASFLVEVGGELRGHGRKPDDSAWQVAVEMPQDETATVAVVALEGLSIATSGDYRRYFGEGIARYSHTIDPRTGSPVAHGLASVTVLHPQCMHADALATALTVLGPESGLAYANRNGLAALFITHDGGGFRSRATPAFVARQHAA